MIRPVRLLALLLLSSCRSPGIADDDSSSARAPPAVLALGLEGHDVRAPIARTGGTMWLDERSIVLDDVAAASANEDPVSREFGVLIQLGPKGTESLAEVTEAHPQERLAVLVEGEVVMAPRIACGIESGQLWVGSLTESEAEELASRIGSN